MKGQLQPAIFPDNLRSLLVGIDKPPQDIRQRCSWRQKLPQVNFQIIK